MRLSVLKDDPGFNPKFSYHSKEFLDGSEVDFTQTADDGLSSNDGYILQVAADSNGHPIADYDKDELVKKELGGNVSIELGKR